MKLAASIVALVVLASHAADVPVSYKLVKAGDTQKQLITTYPDTRCVVLRTLTRCELRGQSWDDLDAITISFFVIDGVIERIGVQIRPEDWEKALATLRSRHGNASAAAPTSMAQDEVAREIWAASDGSTARAQKFGGRAPFAVVTLSTAKALALEAKAGAQRVAVPKPGM